MTPLFPLWVREKREGALSSPITDRVNVLYGAYQNMVEAITINTNSCQRVTEEKKMNND